MTSGWNWNQSLHVVCCILYLILWYLMEHFWLHHTLLLTPTCFYTGCNRRKRPNFGRVFLMLNYTDITQNTHVQSWTVSDNGKWSLKLWQLLHTYWLPNSYWNWQEYVVSVMLISVLHIKITCEWRKAINLNCKVPRTSVKVIHRVWSTIHHTGMLSGDVTRLVWLPACRTREQI